VSRGEHTLGPTWRGLPLAMEVRWAFERCRISVGGTIVSVVSSPDETPIAPDLGYRCALDDGTGQIDLLFLGRDRVPGLTGGARCHIEGTARMDHGRLTVWNPLYRLELRGSDGDEPPRRSMHG
jgi:hypothetical protein